MAYHKEIMEPMKVNLDDLKYTVQLKLYDIMIPLLSVIIIVLNFLVVCSSGLILRKKLQSRCTYIFLGNVALADMLTGVATLIGQYYPKHSELICCIEIGLIISATLASVYSIALIAVDRFLYILYGLRYQSYLSSQRARLMVLGTWLLGGIVGFLPAMGVRNPVDCEHCWLILLEPTALVLTTVSIGFVPLVVIIVLYGIILRRALSKIAELKNSQRPYGVQVIYSERSNSSGNQSHLQSQPPQLRYFRGGNSSITSAPTHFSGKYDRGSISCGDEQPVTETTQPRRSLFNWCRRSNSVSISSVYSPSRWKAIKIVLLTTGCFFVTWFPYFLACALYAMCDPLESPGQCNGLRVAIASPLAILGLTNSLLNPIIYAWWHNGFRESAKKAYHDIWRLRIRPKLNMLRFKAKQTPNVRMKRPINNSNDGVIVTSSTSEGEINVQVNVNTVDNV